MKTDVESVATDAPARAALTTSALMGTGVHLALCLTLSVFTLWFLLEFGPPTITMVQGPDRHLIEIGREWHLGNTVGSIFSKIAALTALLGIANFFAWSSYRQTRAGGRNGSTPNSPRRGTDRPRQRVPSGPCAAPPPGQPPDTEVIRGEGADS